MNSARKLQMRGYAARHNYNDEHIVEVLQTHRNETLTEHLIARIVEEYRRIV